MPAAPRAVDGDVVMGAGLYRSDEVLENPRPWLCSVPNLGSGPGYGGSCCLLRRLFSSMPRSKNDDEPANSESRRCAAAGKETGAACKRASLVTCKLRFELQGHRAGVHGGASVAHNGGWSDERVCRTYNLVNAGSCMCTYCMRRT